MSNRITADITLKKLDGQLGKKPFLQKIIYMNLLNEMALVFRLHGLYLVPGPKMQRWAPDLFIVYEHLTKENSDELSKSKFVELRTIVERHRFAKFGTNLKRHVISKKAIESKGIESTLMEMFLILYTIHLTENCLKDTKERPMFLIGNFCGSKTKNLSETPLDNLFLKRPMESPTKLSNMRDVCILDPDNKIFTLSSIALSLFKVQNTPLINSSEIQSKFAHINAFKDIGTNNVILKINPDLAIVKSVKKKVRVVQTTELDPTTVAITSSSQTAPGRVSTRSTVKAVGDLPLEDDSGDDLLNGIPLATVVEESNPVRSKSTRIFGVPSPPIVVVPPAVMALVKSVEEFMLACVNSSDAAVSDKLPDTQNNIVQFINKTTTEEFDSWNSLSEACSQTGRNNNAVETHSRGTPATKPVNKTVTHEQLTTNLELYKSQHDAQNDLTLHVTPSIGEVLKAFEIENQLLYDIMNPCSKRHVAKFVCFNTPENKMLWKVIQGKTARGKQSQLVRILEMANVGGWVTSLHKTVNEPTSNLVVLLEKCQYMALSTSYTDTTETGVCDMDVVDNTDPKKNVSNSDSSSASSSSDDASSDDSESEKSEIHHNNDKKHDNSNDASNELSDPGHNTPNDINTVASHSGSISNEEEVTQMRIDISSLKTPESKQPCRRSLRSGGSKPSPKNEVSNSGRSLRTSNKNVSYKV